MRWKKSGQNQWESSQSGATLEVWKNSKTKKWSVTLIPITGSDSYLSSGKTKSQAFSFARKWMRKHPNG